MRSEKGQLDIKATKLRLAQKVPCNINIWISPFKQAQLSRARFLKEPGVGTEPRQGSRLQGRLPHGENAPCLSGLCPPETVNPKIVIPTVLGFQLIPSLPWCCLVCYFPKMCVSVCIVLFCFSAECGDRGGQRKGIPR